MKTEKQQIKAAKVMTRGMNTCGNHKLLDFASHTAKGNDAGCMGFHKFINPETDETYGSFLVFEHTPGKSWAGSGDEPFEHGFYWQPMFPGCLADADAIGPFKTASDAYNDAQSF